MYEAASQIRLGIEPGLQLGGDHAAEREVEARLPFQGGARQGQAVPAARNAGLAEPAVQPARLAIGRRQPEIGEAVQGFGPKDAGLRLGGPGAERQQDRADPRPPNCLPHGVPRQPKLRFHSRSSRIKIKSSLSGRGLAIRRPGWRRSRSTASTSIAPVLHGSGAQVDGQALARDAGGGDHGGVGHLIAGGLQIGVPDAEGDGPGAADR